MAKKDIVIIADYSRETAPLTVNELCDICGISPDFIHRLIEYQIVHPEGKEADWLFDLPTLQRIQTVLRLQRDLEVNTAGVAVVLDLLDELEELRAQMELMEKHYLR